MLATIQSLREIARRCTIGQPIDGDLARWFGASLEAFLKHQARTIDEALGLRNARGGVPWWLEEGMRLRDQALRDLVRRYLPEMSVSAQASRIRDLAMRYAASAWRFERGLEQMPQRYAGTPSEFLWRAFKSGAPMPIGERQLRNILAH